MDSLKVIPQLFYDLIAYIAPGAASIYFITTALEAHAVDFILGTLSDAPALRDNALVLVLIFLGMAYFTGFLLAVVSYPLEIGLAVITPRSFTLLERITNPNEKSVYAEPVREFFRNDRLLAGCEPRTGHRRLEVNRLLKFFERNPFIVATYMMFDWLLLHKPEAGARAAKYSAEVIMSRSLSLAAFSSATIHVVASIFTTITINRDLILVSLVVGISCLLGHARQLRSFHTLIIHEYYASRCDDVKPQNISTPL